LFLANAVGELAHRCGIARERFLTTWLGIVGGNVEPFATLYFRFHGDQTIGVVPGPDKVCLAVPTFPCGRVKELVNEVWSRLDDPNGEGRFFHTVERRSGN